MVPLLYDHCTLHDAEILDVNKYRYLITFVKGCPMRQKNLEQYLLVMLLYIMLYIVLAYLMLFAALTNAVCLNNASLFFLFFNNIFYDRAMSSPEK